MSEGVRNRIFIFTFCMEKMHLSLMVMQFGVNVGSMVFDTYKCCILFNFNFKIGNNIVFTYECCLSHYTIRFRRDFHFYFVFSCSFLFFHWFSLYGIQLYSVYTECWCFFFFDFRCVSKLMRGKCCNDWEFNLYDYVGSICFT